MWVQSQSVGQSIKRTEAYKASKVHALKNNLLCDIVRLCTWSSTSNYVRIMTFRGHRVDGWPTFTAYAFSVKRSCRAFTCPAKGRLCAWFAWDNKYTQRHCRTLGPSRRIHVSIISSTEAGVGYSCFRPNKVNHSAIPRPSMKIHWMDRALNTEAAGHIISCDIYDTALPWCMVTNSVSKTNLQLSQSQILLVD